MNTEQNRIEENYNNQKKWLKWGPYLSERQWGTVREDYSPHGTAWDYFPHEHARSRVYRWGEDGIAGISDEFCNLCFAVTLWNGKDPILKERLFGLAGPEGNHGEDVKELYYYLDSTPTHSYMKHLYKYPHNEFPYADLVDTNKFRSKYATEYELLDTNVLNENQYFDVFTEYAKADEEDILIKITIHNRSHDGSNITVLPTLWFRNLWSFGLMENKPSLHLENDGKQAFVNATHEKLGEYFFYFQNPNHLLFTENENNTEKIWGTPNASPFVKDTFHWTVTQGNFDIFNEKTEGTKFAPHYDLFIRGESSVEIRLRLSKKELSETALNGEFTDIFEQRQKEADDFYKQILPKNAPADVCNIQRQAFAGMLWSKQYFNIDIPLWLNGDKGQIPPPESRKNGRNSQWQSLNNEDIVSMPDKWEYPWYAAWDLAFHCVPLAMLDAQFAKNQLLLFLREWYQHPNGQIPAYEWAFGDVNPPVHAWSCMQVYKIEKESTGKGDVNFLKKTFHKLLLNFTWWVNRKDARGKNVFEGGFLGLDNIGVFDRSAAIPGGGHLEQTDGTAWMAMFCLNMLEMSLEIAQEDNAYEDMATKFFEHFVYIAESLNRIGHDWTGAWDEKEGFFYDILAMPDGSYIPLKVRSLVGLTTMFATLCLDEEKLKCVPDFLRRLKWFTEYRSKIVNYQVIEETKDNKILLSLIPKDRLERLLNAMLSEHEFLSVGGIRGISKAHENPYSVNIQGQDFGLSYEPGESTTGLFGGNSNWRGPVWMPMNYLLIQSLRKYFEYYGEDFKQNFPTENGKSLNLNQIADELSKRLIGIFEKDENGHRLVNGQESIYDKNPHFKDLVLFYEYFHGDTARGVGASHQTGWTGVVAELIDEVYNHSAYDSPKALKGK